MRSNSSFTRRAIAALVPPRSTFPGAKQKARGALKGGWRATGASAVRPRRFCPGGLLGLRPAAFGDPFYMLDEGHADAGRRSPPAPGHGDFGADRRAERQRN